MSEVYRKTYSKILSQTYLLICSAIVVASMVANLFNLVDMEVLLDNSWTILILCIILSFSFTAIKLTLINYSLTRQTFISILKNTLYGYVMIVGTLSPLVIYGVSFNTGLIIFLLLHFSLLILYIVTIVVDRNKNKGAIKNEQK